jgi:hypothetical protein
MNYWTRENTKEWIAQLEDRLEDIAHYLEITEEWCDEYGVEDDRVIFMCMFLTCIWVSQLRDEDITYIELMEMLGIDNIEVDEEKFYELDDRYAGLTHRELLIEAVSNFDPDD